MNSDQPKSTGLSLLGEELESAREHWWLFLLLGSLLVLGGLLALAYPFFSSVGIVAVLGVVLIVAGVCTIIGAFWAGKWTALLLQILVGILYVVAGIAIRDFPVASTAAITMFAAAFFIVVGTFRIIAALVERFPQWGWALLNGLVTLLLGIIIYDTFPNSALWAVGVLVGVELIFNGWTWIMLSFVIRDLPEEEKA